MGSLYALDEMVRGIVDTLSSVGKLDNTYLVFTSDNGYNLGAHRLIGKQAPYDESMRVPLVIAGPGIEHGTDKHMVAQIDLAPTFLELAGVNMPPDVDGQSLVPLLHDEKPVSWRTDLLGQYAGPGVDGQDGIVAEAVRKADAVYLDIPPWIGLRTEGYLYVRWYDLDRSPQVHERELYDLNADPHQLTSLLVTPGGKAQNAALVANLDARLNELATCSGATCRS